MIFLWLSCRKVSIWIGKYRYKNRYPECHFQRTEKNGPISAGENGFGYDPIFYVPELKKTTAQLSMEEKNKISHRGKALVKMANKLKDMNL